VFELTIEPQCAVIGKRQDLRYKNSSNALFRIDQIVGVKQTTPAQATGAAAVWTGLHYHVAEAPFKADAWKEIDIIGKRWHGRLQDACFDFADLVLAHLRNGIGFKYADPVERAASEARLWAMAAMRNPQGDVHITKPQSISTGV